MSTSDTPSATIKTAQRTFRLVEALKHLDGATIQELTDHVEMSKSSVHDYLKTLEAEGYVVKDGYTYSVGLQFLDLGGYAREQNPLYREAQSVMDEVAQETGELVSLLVEEHGRGCFLKRSRGPKAVNLDTYVGECVDLHSTAVGKAILAYMPEERVSEIIAQYGLEKRTEKTVTDPDELRGELDRICEKGAAVAMEERVQGLCAVAVPIIPGDEVAGSLSIVGPRHRFDSEEARNEHVDRLQNARNVVELNLQNSYM